MIRSLILSALAAVLLAAPAIAQDPGRRPATIAVTGRAELELKPDFARLYALVETAADSVLPAADANRAATDRVLARLQTLGVPREDIRTASLQILQTPPRTDREGREIKTPRFTASHRLEVRTRDLNAVGRLVGEMLAAGDLTFQSLAWGLDREGEGRDEARRAAVRDARRQATIYAEAAGVALGRLVEIRDGESNVLEGQADLPMRLRAAPAAPSVSVVPPATIRATASVQITWELAP